MQLESIRRQWQAHGAKPAHEARLLRAWLNGRPLDSGPRRQASADCLPLALREALPALAGELDRLARLRLDHGGADGSRRLLVELADGQSVESVLLPRDGLCVSSQVGCAVGCTFCMTGRGGLERQLGSAEIVAQVVLARRLRSVSKVVFMGMGEPAHNLDNVIEAIEALGIYGGIGHKNLVLSTVGDRRVFARLPEAAIKPALAISLHSFDPALRQRLLPHAARLDPAELVALGEDYARASGYPIQYQWTLLAGVNDRDEDAEAIADALSGKYAMINFIPYNRVDGLGYERPAAERTARLVELVRKRGVIACVRDSAGQDIEGACGQLRARTLAA